MTNVIFLHCYKVYLMPKSCLKQIFALIKHVHMFNYFNVIIYVHMFNYFNGVDMCQNE